MFSPAVSRFKLRLTQYDPVLPFIFTLVSVLTLASARCNFALLLSSCPSFHSPCAAVVGYEPLSSLYSWWKG